MSLYLTIPANSHSYMILVRDGIHDDFDITKHVWNYKDSGVTKTIPIAAKSEAYMTLVYHKPEDRFDVIDVQYAYPD